MLFDGSRPQYPSIEDNTRETITAVARLLEPTTVATTFLFSKLREQWFYVLKRAVNKDNVLLAHSIKQFYVVVLSNVSALCVVRAHCITLCVVFSCASFVHLCRGWGRGLCRVF